MMKNTNNKPVAQETPYELFNVSPESGAFMTNLTKKFRNRKPWKRIDTQEIRSVIPGTVTTISVGIGDHVSKGEQIMVYEAMKMQSIVRAPFDGVVEKILVKEGEKLAKGILMIYLKSDAEIVIDKDPISSVPDQDE